MTHTLPEPMQIYMRSMGKLLRVTAIATSDAEANAYMSKHENAAVIACCGDFVFMADKWDQGIKERTK